MTEYTYKEVDNKRWDDIEQLFGPQGAYWGCWCTYFLLSHNKFNSSKPAERKEIFKMKIQTSEYPLGIIAYKDNIPAGWLAINPKSTYEKLMKSRVIKPIDDKPVWSIVCFFIQKEFRGQGISRKLLEYAEEYAQNCGASIIESYPINCKKGEKISEDSAFVGLSTLFEDQGFQKAGITKAKSGGKARIIMRKQI